MFNTDTTVPEWEKSPENHTENQETQQNAEYARRAQAWSEAFPNEEAAENPWLTANMEETDIPQADEVNNVAPAEDELALDNPTEMDTQLPMDSIEQPIGVVPNPSQEADMPNQLNSTDNIVANQMQQVWNNGNGGQSLDSAYDELRGSFTAENIQASAEAVEPEVADTIRENKAKGPNSETELALDNNLDQETQSVTSQQQVQADLYNLTASAGATALGAQASAEAAMDTLQQTNNTIEADAAKRNLEEAQRTLNDIQSEIPMVTSQLQNDPLAERTAQDTIRDAQKMVDEAQESLQTAQDAAVEREDFIEENQETIENLQDQGVQMSEINQSIDETGGVKELQEEVELEDEPRLSIFG